MTLPNLLIVGVPKAATGSLFAYLGQHPSIAPASRKEIKYFSPDAPDGRSRPLAWYERFFDGRTDEPFAMEATPAYCYMGPTVIEAIRSTLEHPRAIVILRDPVDRLWSAYTFQRSLGHLPAGMTSFAAYVEACERARAEHPRTVDQGDFKGLSIGMYGSFLPDWDARFGEDLRIVLLEDLAADPRDVTAGCCSWLGLDPSPTGSFDYAARNPTVHPRSLTLARGAARARTWSKRALRTAPGVRRRLRDAYLRANAGALQDRPDAATTAHLREVYADSNRVVGEILTRRGIKRQPGWLEPGYASGTSSAS